MSDPRDVQLQVDLVNLGTISGQKVLDILVACAEDDIQGLVIPPLEVFGSWLLVDRDRIAKGGDALRKTESKVVSFLKLVIGLSGRGLTKALRHNIHLTASFLFAVACSPCFTVEETGKLIHEMMTLKGVLRSYPIHSTPLSQFVRTVIGYGDILEGESPSELYSNLGRVVTERLSSPDALPGLFDTSPVEKLAKILHKVIEELQNMDNRRITMEGCRTGIWLATVFLWLRPKETDVSMNGFRIFPEVGIIEARLSINLVRHGGGDITQWRIHPWHPEKNLENMVERMDDMMQFAQPHQHYPLSAARNQMANSGISSPLLEATGYLAAALVDVACEQGHLCNMDRSSSLPLQTICSDYFLNSYHTIFKRFGWEGLSSVRQNKIANTLKGRISKVRSRTRPPYENDKDDVEIIGTEICECDKEYFDTHGEPMLVEGDGQLHDTIERAIHLATEALLFCFCFKHPVRDMYRPHTTDKLRSHAKILREMLFGFSIPGPLGTRPVAQGYPFWDFRAKAIQLMLQGVTDVDPSDIAIASNGYVAYSAALLEMDTNMTDRRKISAICIIPGALRLEGEQGRFDRIVEARQHIVLSSRNMTIRQHPVKLFSPDRKFWGLDDHAALDTLRTKVEHLISVLDDPIRRRTVYVTTFLYPIRESGPSPLLSHYQAEPPVPTSWARSIDAITFAKHVWEHSMTLAQEESLAVRWMEKGYLESDNMQWCLVGQADVHSRRYISTTSFNEQLRFFEAGNLADGRKIVIRHKQVPLMQCIKEALDAYGDDPNWAIIS
jgi:hypothetical protein